MREHWPDVVKLVTPLAYLLKQHDDDGLELYFLSSETVHKCKTSSALVNLVSGHTKKGTTSLEETLSSQLRDYSSQIEKSRRFMRISRKLKRRSIYVLTDGRLEGGTDRQGQAAIASLVRTLLKAKPPFPKGQIGVQLIMFGQDPGGVAKLDALDRYGATLVPPLDVIDTEPADGNVWKMLLGAINDLFDDDDPDKDSAEPGASSPGPSLRREH